MIRRYCDLCKKELKGFNSIVARIKIDIGDGSHMSWYNLVNKSEYTNIQNAALDGVLCFDCLMKITNMRFPDNESSPFRIGLRIQKALSSKKQSSGALAK